MRKTSLGMLGTAALAAVALVIPAHAAVIPQPGALNYIEGDAAINGSAISSSAVGSAQLNTGDTLETSSGRAEILLTPGVYLRVGQGSAVRMDSPSITDTRVAVLRGQAMVEADEIHDQNNIQIAEGPAVARLEKTGIYNFNANAGSVAVFDGKATVWQGDNKVELKKGRQVYVGGPLKAQKFDVKDAEAADPLYQWSSLRSQYLSEAAAATARTYVINNAGWYGPGWYWNPYWSSYSFIPGAGVLYSPFGWGFYSPVYMYRYAPYYYYNRGGSVTQRPTFPGRSHGSNLAIPPVGHARAPMVQPREFAAPPVMRAPSVPMSGSHGRH